LSPEKRLKDLRTIIDGRLARYLSKGRSASRTLSRAMRYSVFSGGKRIRPVLVVESCRACGGAVETALPAACAIEMVHAFSLIHDDLPAMDDDDTRRGKPTLHRKFDEAAAILAGDALLALAFETIAKHSPKKTSLKIIEELAKAAGVSGMAGGQVLDLEHEGLAKDRRTAELINLNKTAKLFEASCRMGAISSGAGEAKINAMAAFGRNLGLSFQITDDILDKGDYVMSFGITKAKKRARELLGRAKRGLDIFGKGAEALRQIADYLDKRTH